MNNFDIVKYYDEIEALQANIRQTKKELDQRIAEVKEYFKKEFDESLKAKKEPFGIVKTELDGFVVSCDIKKTVSYDQEKLEKIFDKIQKHEDARQYIKVKYEVSETAYKSWSDTIKKIFDEARTVKQGPPKIEIKPKD